MHTILCSAVGQSGRHCEQFIARILYDWHMQTFRNRKRLGRSARESKSCCLCL